MVRPSRWTGQDLYSYVGSIAAISSAVGLPTGLPVPAEGRADDCVGALDEPPELDDLDGLDDLRPPGFRAPSRTLGLEELSRARVRAPYAWNKRSNQIGLTSAVTGVEYGRPEHSCRTSVSPDRSAQARPRKLLPQNAQDANALAASSMCAT